MAWEVEKAAAAVMLETAKAAALRAVEVAFEVAFEVATRMANPAMRPRRWSRLTVVLHSRPVRPNLSRALPQWWSSGFARLPMRQPARGR